MRAQQTGASIRSRVLAGILAMVIVTIAATGVMLYYLLHRDMLQRVDESLKRSTREFSQLVNNPVSAKTGEPYKDSATFLYDVMQASVPAPHEGYVATIGSTLKWTAPSNVNVRLEDDPQFLSWAVSVDLGTEVYLRTVSTDITTYRAVILPAQVTGDPQSGRYVVAFDTDAEVADLNSVFVPYIWISCLALGVAALISWFVTGRMLRPLSALKETARSVSERDLSRRIDTRAKGDLAELTQAFNSMLDRVENAVLANRQLLDDVGHELRTPITIVRGHLEVMDPNDTTEVLEAREVALDELDRMAGLVNDLIQLAKSEELDRASFVSIDLAEFAEKIFSKAQTLGERDWQLETAASGVVRGDAAKLSQAALQLAENAVKYSQDGSAITIGTAWVPGPVGTPISDENIATDASTADSRPRLLSLYIRDEGAGIAPEDLPFVFERFNRGSNAKRADGTGLGLAIVHSIIEAHDATISAQSAVGEGSVFTIVFPHVEQAVSQAEQAIPQIEQAVSQAEQAVSHAEQAVSHAEQAVPQAEQPAGSEASKSIAGESQPPAREE